MAETYTSSFADDAAVDAALDKAESALQAGDVVNALNSTETAKPLSAAQGKALNDAKLNTTGGILGTYAETGATLTPVAGALTIPLDGKTYAVTITAAITSITTTAPDAPNVGSAVVYFQQNSTGGYAVSIPATWYWADGVITPIATAANAKTRLTLVTSPSGNIHADAEVRSVPA